MLWAGAGDAILVYSALPLFQALKLDATEFQKIYVIVLVRIHAFNWARIAIDSAVVADTVDSEAALCVHRRSVESETRVHGARCFAGGSRLCHSGRYPAGVAVDRMLLCGESGDDDD